MNNDEWGNAYAQNKLPDSLSGFGEAVEAAFGREIIGITPTEARFDLFNGINYGGNLYVNLNGNVGFGNRRDLDFGNGLISGPKKKSSVD